MLSGNVEGYTTVQSRTSHKLPCEVSAMFFINLCRGIDEYRQEAWRYDYSPKKIAKSEGEGYDVVVQDIGE